MFGFGEKGKKMLVFSTLCLWLFILASEFYKHRAKLHHILYSVFDYYLLMCPESSISCILWTWKQLHNPIPTQGGWGVVLVGVILGGTCIFTVDACINHPRELSDKTFVHTHAYRA